MLLQALHAHSLLPVRELQMADGDGVHMLTGCGGVSQLFLTHKEEEMEGQWKQRQKTLTHMYQKHLLHVSSWMVIACPCTLGQGRVGGVNVYRHHTTAGSIWTFDCL